MQGKFGLSVGWAGTLYQTLLPWYQQGINTVQFFLGNENEELHLNSIPVLSKEDIDLCLRTFFTPLGTRTFYIHTPLRINIANDYGNKGLKIVNQILLMISQLPCAAVIHMGSKGPNSTGTIEKAINFLNQVNIYRRPDTFPATLRSPLLLENSSGSKENKKFGWNWAELQFFYGQPGFGQKFGFCLDTQHSFAAGLLSFNTKEEIDYLFNGIKQIIPSGLCLIHLNESIPAFDSKVDRHESFYHGNGLIWGRNHQALSYLFGLAYQHGVDIVLETPEGLLDYEAMKKSEFWTN